MSVPALLAQAARSLQAGRADDAIPPLREAARLHPHDAAILHDLGIACLETGLTREAIDNLEAAVRANPRFAKAFWRLGIAFEAIGENDAALGAYGRATALLPSLTEARYRAACLLETMGYRDRAVSEFQRGAASRTSLGKICGVRAALIEDRDEQAERMLRRILALAPDDATALDLLGMVLANAGRLDEARDAYARAITVAPALAGSYYDLVRCRRLVPLDQPLVARMQAALTSGNLDAEQRARVHLALGKAADDLGDPAQAMRHFDEADSLRSTLVAFDADAFEAGIDRMVARFTLEFLASAHHRYDDPTPVLIVGLPRSGTTLVEQILSSHAAVAGGGEMPFWTEQGPRWAAADASLQDLAADYLRGLRTFAPARRVTDKMPLNLIWAGLIHLALPNATIVHCRRDPLDTALSIHSTYFNARLPFPTGGAALVRTVRATQRLADHWRRVLPPDRFIEIDYERLTDDPGHQIRHLVACCGLDWDPACLHPERNARIVKTPSKWQVRQPITRGSVGSWRRYEPWLGPLRALATAPAQPAA